MNALGDEYAIYNDSDDWHLMKDDGSSDDDDDGRDDIDQGNTASS